MRAWKCVDAARGNIARIWMEGEYRFSDLKTGSHTGHAFVDVEVEQRTVCYLFQPEVRLVGIDVSYPKKKVILRYTLPRSGPGYILMTRTDEVGMEYSMCSFREAGESTLANDWKRWNVGTAYELQHLLKPPFAPLRKKPRRNSRRTFYYRRRVITLQNMPDPAYNYRSYVKTSLRYPRMARRKGIEGVVYVNFAVHTDGSIQDVRLTKGVEASLDQEALRLVRNMPSWIPGMQRGVPVRVRCQVPITFQLTHP